MSRLLTSGLLWASLATLSWAQERPPEEPQEPEEQLVQLRLEFARVELAQGESAEIQVSWENKTREPVELILPCDGSTVGWRMPHYIWELRDEQGELVPPPQLGRCGLVNPLQLSDFMQLPAGKKKKIPVGWLDVSSGVPTAHLKPGSYTVRLRYNLDRKGNPNKAEPAEQLPEEIKERWEQAREGTVVSNPVEIRIRAVQREGKE